MKLHKKLISVLLTTAMAASLSVPVLAANEEITVLYTNDIHSYIDNHLDEENGFTYS